MLVKTMALKITEKSHPVAVACLGPWFLDRTVKSVTDSYLVINEIGSFGTDGDAKTMTISNRLYTREEFAQIYEFVDPELKTNFTEVRRR